MKFRRLGVALAWLLLAAWAAAALPPEAKRPQPAAPTKAPEPQPHPATAPGAMVNSKGAVRRDIAPAKASGNVPMRKVPLLGIATTDAMYSPEIKTGLPDGVGLIVQHVSPDTPAAQAGFEQFDVLHKLNDQILINNLQLRVLLRTMKPGKRVTFSVLRQSQPVSVEVRLGEADVPVIETPYQSPYGVFTPARSADSQAALTANYEDNQHLLTLQVKALGEKHLVVRDKLLGTVLFDGPISTEQQRRAVPDAVREKLKKLENPPPPKPATP